LNKAGSRKGLAGLAGRRIFGLMGNTLAGGIQIVAAAKDGKTVFWAAAVPRDRAVEAVQEFLAPGWTATLTARHITPERVASLKLRPNGVRELGPTL
jgi:hypothetical protein